MPFYKILVIKITLPYTSSYAILLTRSLSFPACPSLFLSVPCSLSLLVPLCLSPSLTTSRSPILCLSFPVLAEEEGGSTKLKPYAGRDYCSLTPPCLAAPPFTRLDPAAAALAYPPRAETDFLPGLCPAQSSGPAGLPATGRFPPLLPFNWPCGGCGRDHICDFLRGCAALFFCSGPFEESGLCSMRKLH